MPIGVRGFQKGNQAAVGRKSKYQKAPIVRERLIAELYKRDLSRVKTEELIGFFKVIQPKEMSVDINKTNITYISNTPRPNACLPSECIDTTATTASGDDTTKALPNSTDITNTVNANIACTVLDDNDDAQ